MPDELINYRNEKFNFIQSLNRECFENFYFRPYFTEHGSLPEIKYLKNKFNGLRIYSKDLTANLHKLSILIIDHPGTTLNISMAWNIPTIFYWDQKYWDTCQQFEPTLHKLKIAGIFHESGQNAAVFLNSIYPNIEEWWNSKQVQEARKEFCQNYALGNKNWKSTWYEKIKVIAEA
jgi:putative transferase (TIGR04331 family)